MRVWNALLVGNSEDAAMRDAETPYCDECGEPTNHVMFVGEKWLCDECNPFVENDDYWEL